MADILTQSERSALMARIRAKDTRPELVVRQTLHALGYRFRLHVRHLQGTPDLAFPARHKALFVHGCFWHAHDCQHGLRRPSTNTDFWSEKARANRERDARKEQQLRDAGWDVATVWECETKSREQPWLARIVEWLGPPGQSTSGH
jgi:DNA mismatch endonuclease, patch repair protein